MTEPVAIREKAELLERVVIGGDLSALTPTERLQYYREVCASVGLNPLTKPFEYIRLSGKLVLYALKGATDQLRQQRDVSIHITAREQVGDIYVVSARATILSARDNGIVRDDESIGAVATKGLAGEALANALMKAETKAKRRVTLSICGLGMLDETEVETIPGAVVVPDGELAKPLKAVSPPETPPESATQEAQAAPEPPTAPLDEWIAAFGQATSLKALQALWKGVTKLGLWETWGPIQQESLTMAKDEAKKRLGVA